MSLRFIIFLIVLLIAYYLFPRKHQWLLLLAGSYVFYAYANPFYLIFLLLSTVTTYLCGVWMGREDEALCGELAAHREVLSREEKRARKAMTQKRKKQVMAICLVFNLLILGLLKYTNFFLENMNLFLRAGGSDSLLPRVNWLLPLGISFYTFMTIGYCVDVYRGICEPQKDFFKYALFVSYFPQITQGPINRYSNMEGLLYGEHSFDWQRCKEGGYRILTGLFKKLVIAERLAVYVDRVFGMPEAYGSMTLLFAAVFYAIQIYCDFSGYMDIVLGISELFGIRMAENFNKPFFSKSIPEYWRRWHMTLNIWFKDYLYYPVIRSEFCTKIGKKLGKRVSKEAGRLVPPVIGLLAVWFLTGLWHGASWHYVAHGLYHGIIIIFGILFGSVYKRLRETLHIRDDSKTYHVFQMVRTFLLVDISFILFRASSVSDAFFMIKQIFFYMDISISALKDAILPFTEDNTAVAYFGVAATAILLLFLAEVMDYNGKDTVKKHRYLGSAVMIVLILLFGIFGQSEFIYMQY
ncbi:MAG: MBOAT family O-acyltransferase [Lachnospiraceae bacterium]